MRIVMQSGNGSHNGLGKGLSQTSRGAVPSLPEEFTSRETVKRVRKAVAELPENYREAVVLCDLEEMTYEEAAGLVGCPVGTIRSRLHRGRAILMERLAEKRSVGRAPAIGE